MINALNSGLAQKVGLPYSFPISATLNANISDITKAFHDCFVNAISNPDYTVRKALDEYAVAMEKAGAQQVLVEANNAIGKTTTQRY
jgi:hypothetical protein